MNQQICGFCEQPVDSNQDQTRTADGLVVHTECSAKAGGETIYIPGNDNPVDSDGSK
jgi:hypothetical protein